MTFKKNYSAKYYLSTIRANSGVTIIATNTIEHMDIIIVVSVDVLL